MQSHNRVGYTDRASILQIIEDSTEDTYYKANSGDSLKQVVNKFSVYSRL